MRDRETIDSELRRLAMERRFFREHGDELSISELDDLLDERLGHRPAPRVSTAVHTRKAVVMADKRSPRRRPRTLRRLARRAVVPVSIVTIATVVVVMLTLHYRHHQSEPTVVPQADEQPRPPAPPQAVAPVKAPKPQDTADKALIDVLQREGVPTPNQDYVTTQGHAVCDFLGRQPDLTEAAHFVQRSTIWDADQSTQFTSAAVVTYCPQFGTAGSDKMQQTLQTSQSNLHAIQGDLQGIKDDLQNITDGLHVGN